MIDTFAAVMLNEAVVEVVNVILGRKLPVPKPMIDTQALFTLIHPALVIVSVYPGAT